TSRPLRLQVFRGSIPHPTRSLCTLRHGRHLPQRNTRYRAGATPYPGRTFTGWIAPASPGAPGLPSFLCCTERVGEDRLPCQHFSEPLDEGAQEMLWHVTGISN